MAGVLFSQTPAHALLFQGDWSSTLWNREDLSSQDGATQWQTFESLRLRASQGSLSAYIHPRVSRLADWETRLYQGYLDWRGAHVQLRLGRQFLPNDVGFWQMDGIRGSLSHRWLRAKIYGGSAMTPWGNSSSGIAGADVQWTRAPFARTRGNVVAIFRSDAVERLIVGGEFGTLGGSLLGVHMTERRPLQLQGRFNVDLLSQTLVSGYAYSSAGIKQARVYGEYRKETPLFPEDSIFTVFAIEPLEQLAVGTELRPMQKLTLHGRYARQLYDTDSLDRYRVGFRLAGLSSSLERIQDGRVEYWRVYSQLQWTANRLMLRLGHYYNNYRKAPSSNLETAYSYQAQFYYLLGRYLQLMLRVEDNVNPDFEYNVRVLGSLKWRFQTSLGSKREGTR